MGLLPECDLTDTLWYKVAIDLIGPWSEKLNIVMVNSMPQFVLTTQKTLLNSHTLTSNQVMPLQKI